MQFTIRKNPRSRRVSIRIDQNCNILVTAPKRMPNFLIDRFVEQKDEWIKQTINKMNQKRNMFDSVKNIMIFGNNYNKQIVSSIEHPIGVSINNESLLINSVSKKHDNSSAQQQINKFLKKTSKKYILPRTDELAKKMNVSFKRISIKEQKSRWGSCSSQQNLNFNWRLVHHVPKIIDYVIIHELSHIVHLDHSKHFWEHVKKYDPEFRQHRGYLKRTLINLG